MRPVGQFPEERFERALALVNEQDLVAAGVAVEVRHRLGHVSDPKGEIVVDQQRDPRLDRVAGRHAVRGAEMAVADGLVRHASDPRAIPGAHLERRRRRPQMVQQGVGAVEAFGRDQFLGVESPVGAAELDVSFVRQRAGAHVVSHGGRFAKREAGDFRARGKISERSA